MYKSHGTAFWGQINTLAPHTATSHTLWWLAKQLLLSTKGGKLGQFAVYVFEMFMWVSVNCRQLQKILDSPRLWLWKGSNLTTVNPANVYIQFRLNRLRESAFQPWTDGTFFNRAKPGLFLFISVLFNNNFTEKCRYQRDSNLYRQSRRRARWQLDHNHGPMELFGGLSSFSKLWSVWSFLLLGSTL